MEFPSDRRVIIGAGIALAVLAGVGLALMLGAHGKDGESGPAGKSLVIKVGQDDGKFDATRQLPCYVNGQSIGMATHAKCAEKNGVSSGQLDVGIDQSGELAYGAPDALLTPLPPAAAQDGAGKPLVPPPAQNTPAPASSAPSPAAKGPVAACWRYSGHDWTRLADAPLSACVQVLFDGQCEKPGGALYGRWSDQTLRLVPGEVEESPDNRNFRTLVQQGANCSVPAF